MEENLNQPSFTQLLNLAAEKLGAKAAAGWTYGPIGASQIIGDKFDRLGQFRIQVNIIQQPRVASIWLLEDINKRFSAC